MPLSTLAAFNIDDSIKSGIPRISLGLISSRVSVGPSDNLLLTEIEALITHIRSEIALDQVPVLPEVCATRESYRALGKDPSRYRGSAEALLRRVLSGKSLYKINNVVDVNNLISLKARYPVGSYDADRIDSHVSFRLGTRSEAFKGIGKETVNTANLPLFADSRGAFGSPTSDSERTMIRTETTSVLTVVIVFGPVAGLPLLLKESQELLEKYASASIQETRIV